MYWLITCYDVLRTLHLTVRCVGTEEGDAPLEPVYTASADLSWEAGDSLDDVLATIGTGILDMAYGRGPDWTGPRGYRGIPVSPDET